jgi:hypothetical protein
MTTDDRREPTRDLTAKSAYVALFFALPVLLVFVLLGKWEMGIGAWICIGLVLIVVRSHWDLRANPWFWVSIALSVLFQIPLILMIPWNSRSVTGIILLPVAVVDYALVYGCIGLSERMAKKTRFR